MSYLPTLFAASVHSLATPFGSLISGPLADYLGRRKTLLVSVIPLFLGWSTMAMSNSVKALIFARFLCGFATGILGGPGQVRNVTLFTFTEAWQIPSSSVENTWLRIV